MPSPSGLLFGGEAKARPKGHLIADRRETLDRLDVTHHLIRNIVVGGDQ